MSATRQVSQLHGAAAEVVRRSLVLNRAVWCRGAAEQAFQATAWKANPKTGLIAVRESASEREH